MDHTTRHSTNPADDPNGLLTGEEQRQLHALLNALCEGMLNDSQARLLKSWLLANPQARSLYIQYLHLHASLAYADAHPEIDIGAHTPPPPLAPGQRKSSRERFPHGLQGWQIAACLGVVAAMIGTMAWILNSGPPKATAPYDLNRIQYVARVIANANCQWDDQTAGAAQGELLKVQDQLNLLSGLAKVRFDCGAEVILRGPAQLRVDSGMDCYLNRGELSATVPEVAHGFTVSTPLGQVVDLGTRFGVNVDKEIEVQVFEGECELQPKNNLSHAASSVPNRGAVGLFAGGTSKMTLDSQQSVVRVIDLQEPKHQFAQTLPQSSVGVPSNELNTLAVDSFGQGGPGTRVVGRNGGFGWGGPWQSTLDSNSVSFLLGTSGAMSRGAGDGVVQRRLGSRLSSAKLLYFSAEFQLDGPDPRCSVWLELFRYIPHMWSNGDTDLAVIGITDGQFSGRLAPFQSQKEERLTGDCGRYTRGSRHLIVGKLEFDADDPQERLSVWIDPAVADESEPDKVIIRDTGRPGADAVAIRCWDIENDDTVATVDEVRVGLSWLSVIQ